VIFPSRPPYTPTQNYDAIRADIRRLLRITNISGVGLGAPVMRHTVASTMVNRGANFKEVADVLGHKNIQTTTIYAKLNLTELAEVALPWKGGRQ
jgi:site-specific recombinase XerD